MTHRAPTRSLAHFLAQHSLPSEGGQQLPTDT